jgi:SPP1 gp7 family putative phage head morphogenesis protein
MRFNLPPEHALLFVKARGLKLQESTDDVVEAILKGMEAGMPSDEIAAQVGKVFKHCSEVRAKTIARTETTVAYNGGRVDGMKELGIKKKQWINSNDDNVRDSHRIFNEEAVVEIDSPFTLANGVKVMYPGDGPAAEACNCRCTVASVIE